MRIREKFFFVIITFVMMMVLITSCKKDDPAEETVDWTYGQSASYSVLPGTPVTDSLSGYVFTIPSTGTTLKITRILSGPETPFGSKRFKIEYTGDIPLRMQVSCTKGSRMVGMMYGYPDGLYNGPLQESWLGLAEDEVSQDSSVYTFSIPQLYDVPTLKDSNPKKRGSQLFSFISYDKIFPEFDKMTIVEMKLDNILEDAYIAACNSPLKEQVIAARAAKSLHVAFGNANFYEPWWVRLGYFGGEYYSPTISFKYGPTNPTDADIAHETAHFFINLVIGNEKQKILSRQGSTRDEHAIGNVNGRDYLVDEFAFFCETMTETGGLIRMQLSEPADALGGNPRSSTDYPGIEGFAGSMLYSLVRPAGVIKDVNNRSNKLDIQSIGLTTGQVLDIVAMGATGVNQLKTNIENYLSQNCTPLQNERFRLALQRLGWSYSVQGTLVNAANAPLAGYTVTNVFKGDAGREYANGEAAGAHVTAADGSFSITGYIFPGSSTLRFTKGSESADFDVVCPFDGSTAVRLVLPPYKMNVSGGGPTATTLAATNIVGTTVTLNGTVNPNGSSAWSEFEYGLTTAYGSTKTLNVEYTGTQAISISTALTGLQANKTYHYRCNAYRQGYQQVSYGADMTFTLTDGITLGQQYQGGIVVYVDQTGQHGLIAAPGDIGTTDWGCQGTYIGAEGNFGNTNTTLITAGCSSQSNAAAMCANYTGGGYTDWYLPSNGEMTTLLFNGNYLSDLQSGQYYWSSSEVDATQAYSVLYLQPGTMANWYPVLKNSTHPVRPMRSF